MSAMLTWWGLSITMENQPAVNARMIDAEALAMISPAVVAVLAGLIRILMIGTLARTLAVTKLPAGRQQTSVSRAQLRRLVVPSRAGSSAPVVPHPFECRPGHRMKESSSRGTGGLKLVLFWRETTSHGMGAPVQTGNTKPASGPDKPADVVLHVFHANATRPKRKGGEHHQPTPWWCFLFGEIQSYMEVYQDTPTDGKNAWKREST